MVGKGVQKTVERTGETLTAMCKCATGGQACARGTPRVRGTKGSQTRWAGGRTGVGGGKDGQASGGGRVDKWAGDMGEQKWAAGVVM